MTNPERILRELDRHLRRPTRLILFGRAALALGFEPPDPTFAATRDVDMILPSVDMASIESDDQFWEAVDQTNRELEPSGLYITHLFGDDQIVIRPDWLDRIVPITFGLQQARLFRPASLDLLMTKMMRNDPQELEDIRFLLRREQISRCDIEGAVRTARVPDLPELRTIFAEMVPLIEALADTIHLIRNSATETSGCTTPE